MDHRKRSKDAGFSVVEVLVGILILAIVSGGLIQGLAFTSTALGKSRVQSIATNLATGVLEDVQATEYVNLGTVGGDPAGAIVPNRTQVVDGITFQIQTSVVLEGNDPTLGQADTGANYKRVTVRVTPQTQGAKTYTQSTILAPPVEGARAGQAYIAATVRDSYNDGPVSGATVTLNLNGVNSSKTTAASGQVIFPGLAPGAATLTISKTGYVTAASDGPTQLQRTLRAGEPWQPTVSVFKPATVVAQVVDDTTGNVPSQPVTVTLTTPDGGSATQVGSTGTFTFTQVSNSGGAPHSIAPSIPPVTLAAAAECYDTAQVSGPLPESGYPDVTSETFELRLTSQPHGELNATLTTGTGAAISGATIQVTGGDSGISRSLTTNSSGAVFACLPPSGSTPYTLTADVNGYVATATAAVTLSGATTVALVQPGSIELLYGLLPGTSIRIRQGATVVRQGTTTGLLLGVGVQFTGVPPGTYTAERWIQPLLGAGSWGGAKTVTVQSGAYLSYTL